VKLAAEEEELLGTWITSSTGIKKDRVCERIEALVAHHLQELGKDRSGWDTLFRDPDDGRLWELAYPASTSEGGGPPRLSRVSAAAARDKYGHAE